MALLPQKELLDGTKNPETTTGEFRVAIGHMRDYLFELLGENSAEKEEARAALGAVSASDIQRLRHTSAIADGTADAVLAVFEPTVRQLTNATTLTVRAQFRNETKTPTFKADETSALPIVKGTDQSLEKGDIRGEGHWLELKYDETLNKWVLQNPANGVFGSGIPYTQASGTPDVIVAHFNPPLVELKDGLKVSIQATAANISGEPYLQVENFEAYPLVKNVNQQLLPGDISGKGYRIDCQFDGINEKWILQNPARGIIFSGVPVGCVLYFAASTPPAGFLKADGSEVGRESYPDLFRTTGTIFGEGDSLTTFNLPDLINRFPQGGTMPGQKIGAGLPNIEGYYPNNAMLGGAGTGVFTGSGSPATGQFGKDGGGRFSPLIFNAANSNPIYGSSDTVQPPALTLLPCIKAFDTVPATEGQINTLALTSKITAKANRADIEPCLSQASVSFDASSGIVVIKNVRNVQGVVRVEKGVYDVIFDNPMNVDTLTVTASSSAILTSVNRESLTGAYYAPTKDRIRIVTGSGFPPEAEDAADINVIILV